MPDREKIIKALEICEKKDCVLCPYTEWCGEYDDSYFYDCTKLLAKDALALLKEQDELRKTYVGACDDLYAIAKNRVDVVRCKDCKYSLSNSRFCAYPHKMNNIQPDDWFCADGERRTEDD